SGQLGEIIDSFTDPFLQAGMDVEKVSIIPQKDYPFPWTTKSFFSVMPDSVLGNTIPLQPFFLKEEKYDLIILGYQAWFLSPSIPVRSLLQDKNFQKILYDTPIITITGARNMWLNAFGKIKNSLNATGAKLSGNIALVDKHANPLSFVTIFHWMLSGRKDRYLGVFPMPGVSERDIQHCAIFGATVLKRLEKNDWKNVQAELVEQGAVKINYPLLIIETVAGKLFKAWANFISKRKNKSGWLVVFKYYLLFAFFIGAPIMLTLDFIFVKPFSANRITRRKNFFLHLD
ncbi:MAG: hypothetical protein ABI653_06200, partial [Bacteroidota bacterium]